LCRPELDSEYLLKDLFEDITIFSNRTLEAPSGNWYGGRLG
jgi:hypothetical protein